MSLDKVRWGVIGAGGIANRRTIPALKLADNAELIAVMEVNTELSKKLCEKYEARYAYTDYNEMLSNPDIDAVYIASPVAYHKAQIIASARAGKHVLCEKPIAMTAADCEEVIRICDESGILASIGFMMRHHAHHKKIRKMILSGDIGQVVSARAQLTCWYPEIEGAWRQDKAQSGGGALMDLGIHCVDLIEYITGGKTIKTAAFNETKTFGYNVEDSSLVILKLDNGVTASIDTNFNIPDDAAFCRLEFYGTKGSILAEGTIGQEETGTVKAVISTDNSVYDANQSREINNIIEVNSILGNMYTKEIESFSDSILLGNPVEIPIHDALHIQSVIAAAYKSSESEAFVNVES